jgi:hypothetical protein
MSDTFIQKDLFFKTNKFELTETGIKGHRKTLFGSTEFFVDYNNLGVRILKTKSGSRRWLIAAGVFLLFFVAVLFTNNHAKSAPAFHILASMICVLVYLLTYKRGYFLVQPGNRNALQFFYDKPSQSELDNFIAAIKEKRNNVLCSQFGKINSLLPYQQNHSNLLWLYNNDALTKEEFDKKLVELDSGFKNPKENKIGF